MAISILPIRRNLKFNLNPAKALTWHRDGLNVSQFMNTMSLFFPVGERFFIDSVRNYRDQITDPELKKAVTAFIGQEAMHGREHEEYNDALTAKGLPADRYENIVLKLLNFFRRFTPKGSQLAGTIALEHLTAILAHRILVDKSRMAGAEPRYGAIWHWHALEETEHKAVAYDVYGAVMKNRLLGYLRRCFALIMSTTIFFIMLTPFYLGMVAREKGQLFNLKGWWKVTVFLWGPKGVLLRALPDWLDFFRPGFHPWDHDNREFLQEIDDLVTEVESYKAQGAAA